MAERMGRREALGAVGLGALAVTLGGASSCAAAPAAIAKTKEYELPRLPYGYDALAPQIEERVLRLHHTKHHAGYVRGLNATLAKLGQARAAGDFVAIKALSRDLAFHGSGHVLHTLYWQSMQPSPAGEPAGALRAAIERDFGSLAAFRAQFAAAANKVEGSGWAVLGFEPMGRRLLVLQAEKHQNLTIWGVAPLLVCDVWEHAYYAQYHNRRGDYVEAFCALINWPGAARRFAQAVG